MMNAGHCNYFPSSGTPINTIADTVGTISDAVTGRSVFQSDGDVWGADPASISEALYPWDPRDPGSESTY